MSARRRLAVVAALLLMGAAPHSPIVFVPLDDRPVTLQLPRMLGRIAGVPVAAPPRALLGRYLRFGAPDAVIAWLNSAAPQTDDYVLSSDMLAYGGLVASRVPGPSYADAFMRLRELDRIRQRLPHAWIGVFGTVMRLAPTGVPPIGAGASFFAPYPAWTYLQAYANLHDPLLPSELARAQALRAQIGEPLLDRYLAARARDYGIDRLLIDKTASGTIDRLVLGQDDAKPYGLHVPEIAALESAIAATDVGERATIQPGADELGMAMVANALARRAHWVHLPEGPLLDDAFVARIRSSLRARERVALVDLSFEGSYAEQSSFVARILNDGIAARLDAYAAWNTAANSTGTALAEAIAAGAGRRIGTYDALAHDTFTFVRFVDDGDFHDDVRPELNDWLTARGVSDHTLLIPPIAQRASERDRALLWNDAQRTLQQLYPALHVAAMRIDLPWDRTFETAIHVRLAPALPRR